MNFESAPTRTPIFSTVQFSPVWQRWMSQLSQIVSAIQLIVLQFRIQHVVASFTSTAGAAAVNLVLGDVQQHVLTENTTAAISSIIPGQRVTFIIVQHAAAAKTFGWPATVHGGMVVSATLSSINVQEFIVSNNGTDLYACDAGSVGLAGGTP